ncbi:hypothetical protein EK21DRAFT_52151 [Setomelanomma holmii]|uniref:HTH APSES-type domain-containing protein n=1 Tax=Setomelanomma holmii TaxID=210430 RepID=A0A9P4HLX8_9PLEO|nr:hypothetical protein EK21DRAFT_52151 [Setomelanomma holmii]
MKITSLLNPFCGDDYGYRGSEFPVQASILYPGPQVTVPKRQKIAKDAPVFSEGNKIVGVVNYPPHEAGNDQDLITEHRRFQVFPLGEIRRKGVRHIPYNSDKKDFLEKTGRDAFEMFQYTYKRPGEDKEYVVVWDYNVGLVRMTPFFKSCKYSKTIPAKAIRENPGLKDISYSITGGALVCQGYWMPYQAAKAIAATFCYDIGWALTPIFGNDFPSMCLHPKDSSFAKFLIDPAIVHFCTVETNRFRTDGASYRLSQPKMSSSNDTPRMCFGQPPWTARISKQRHTRPADIESGYGTDTDQSDKCAFSPQVSPRSEWTSVNRSLSPCSPGTTNSSAMSSPISTYVPPVIQTPTSAPSLQCEEQFRTKRTHSKVAMSDSCDDRTLPRPQMGGNTNSKGMLRFNMPSDIGRTQNDLEVAELLMSLGTIGRTLLRPTKRTRRGSTM